MNFWMEKSSWTLASMQRDSSALVAPSPVLSWTPHQQLYDIGGGPTFGLSFG